MTNLVGLNLQKAWNTQELQRVNPAWLVVYEESAASIPELRAALPNVHICLRLFNDFEEPLKLAERGAGLARDYLRPGDCTVWANETNIEIPTLSVDRTIDLHRRFINRWREVGWPAALCSPALSPSAPNADLAPYREVFLACDYIGVHAYRGAEQHLDQADALWPRYRKLVTEFGTDHGDRAAYCRDFLMRLAGRSNYVGACWFLWDGEPMWNAWKARGTPVADVLAEFAKAPSDEGASSLEEPMPDNRVKQPLGEPSCLVAASMGALEIMSQRDVIEAVTPVYQEAVAAGLYANTSDVPAAILAIMRFVGERGVACEGGRAYGADPYRVPVAEMIDALRAGLRPFVWWYDPKAPDGSTHAVAATAVQGDQLITADQTGVLPSTTWAFPLDFARANGLGAFAFASHTVVEDQTEEPMPEPAPPATFGVEYDHFGEWRAAAIANGTDFTDAGAFQVHLVALGADPMDLHRWGFPRFAPVAPPPEPEPTPPPAPVVLDASNVDIGPAIASIADRYGLPPWALHGCLIAESGMNPRAERWADRSTRGRELTARIDRDPGDEAAYNELQRLMDDLKLRGVHYDCSWGYSQLIWSTAGGYGIGDGQYTLANLLDVRRQLFDRATSIDLGARHLALCYQRVRDELGDVGDEIETAINALIVYNSGSIQRPGSSYFQNYSGNVAAYKSAIRQARPLWD